METALKEINSYTRELDVKVPWNLLSANFEKEFKKAQSNFELKGFRKGKVPLNIVKKNLLPSIEANFAHDSLNDYFRKALIELAINPINQAKIVKMHFHEGSDLEFVAEFEVRPIIKLPNYKKKFKIKTIRYLASSQDVEMALKESRERHSTVKTIDSGAETGHFINGDFTELDKNGEKIPGTTLEKQYIKLGEGLFIEEVEKSFHGVKQDDVVRVEIILQDNRKVTYLVDINKVEEQILPELNDDFAVSADPDVKTMNELNAKIEVQIQNSLDREHEKTAQKEIIDYFVKKTKFDAPKSMIENYLDHIVEDFKNKDNQEAFDEDTIRSNYMEIAKSSVKWYLIKDVIVTSAELDVSNDLIKDKIDEFISQNPKQKKDIIKFYKQSTNKEKLYEDLLNEILFQHINEFVINKITEKSTLELKKGKK